MQEIDMLKRAKMYMDMLCAGVDPVTNEDVCENDSTRSEKTRCCFNYISSVLQTLIDKDGKIPGGKKVFYITAEQKKKIVVSEEPVGISRLCKMIGDVLEENTKAPSNVKVAAWLMEQGYLQDTIYSGKHIKTAAPKGRVLGIETITAVNKDGFEFKMNMYNKNAQIFIIDNIEQAALGTCEA